MKHLLFSLMLLALIKSNGQKTINYVTDTSIHTRIEFATNTKPSAYIRNGSDTLVITDTIMSLYGHDIIRYIKIEGVVYPLKKNKLITNL